MKTIYWVIDHQTIRTVEVIFETELNYLGKVKETGMELLFEKKREGEFWYSDIKQIENLKQ